MNFYLTCTDHQPYFIECMHTHKHTVTHSDTHTHTPVVVVHAIEVGPLHPVRQQNHQVHRHVAPLERDEGGVAGGLLARAAQPDVGEVTQAGEEQKRTVVHHFDHQHDGLEKNSN